MPNYVTIGQTVVEIYRFWIFLSWRQPPSWILKFYIFKDWNSQERQTESQCQILSKSFKPRRWHVSFRFYKMAAAAILDFSNFKFLNLWTVNRVDLHHRTKVRQNRTYRGRDITIFRFFKMAAAAILDFPIVLIFNSRNCQGNRIAPACQILWKSVEPRLRYAYF